MRASPRLRSLRALSLVLLFAASSAAEASARQWYEHYQRGLALLESGNASAALAELEMAARQEPRPREKARTYGTQFLFGYDPYFHEARCLLELGRFREAASALDESARAGVTPAAEIAAFTSKPRSRACLISITVSTASAS